MRQEKVEKLVLKLRVKEDEDSDGGRDEGGRGGRGGGNTAASIFKSTEGTTGLVPILATKDKLTLTPRL